MKSAHSRADVEHAAAIHLHRQDSSPMKFQLIDRRHYALAASAVHATLAQNDDSVDDEALAGVSDSFDAAELIPAAASAFEPILLGQDLRRARTWCCSTRHRLRLQGLASRRNG
jgi:hypothetical protein